MNFYISIFEEVKVADIKRYIHLATNLVGLSNMKFRHSSILKLNNKRIVIMKMDNSKFEKNGELKNGVHKEYFKDGSVSCEGQFKDGERTGKWKYYLANGRLKAIGNYKDGKMTGDWKWYRENGKLMQTGSFDNEIKIGLWTRYKVDGNLMDETEFVNGKKGKVKTY